MAAAPSSCPVPPMTKDQKEVESNKQQEGFCKEWSQKSKGHVWFPLSNLPLVRRLGLYRRRLMLSISIGRYIPSKTTLLGTRFCHLYFRGSSFQSQDVALNRDCKYNRVGNKSLLRHDSP